MRATPAQHRLEHLAFRLARGAASVAPEPMALGAGLLLGLAVGSLVRFRRRDVERHLGWAFPDSSAAWRRRVARASYAHFGREAAVMLRAPGWSRELLRERTHMVGFDAFREAAESGRGVVMLTGHLGNWEVGGASIAARGVPLDVVGKGMSNRPFQADLFATRARLGMRVIEMGEAAKEVPRSLGAGRVVALLGDQRAHRGGVLVPFFGRPASTARGPALFALRSGASVFVAFALHDGGSPLRYTVTFEALPFSRRGSMEEDVEALLAAYGEALEAAIRRAPEQYFWQHRRWKNAPEPQPRPEPPSDG